MSLLSKLNVHTPEVSAVAEIHAELRIIINPLHQAFCDLLEAQSERSDRYRRFLCENARNYRNRRKQVVEESQLHILSLLSSRRKL